MSAYRVNLFLGFDRFQEKKFGYKNGVHLCVHTDRLSVTVGLVSAIIMRSSVVIS